MKGFYSFIDYAVGVYKDLLTEQDILLFALINALPTSLSLSLSLSERLLSSTSIYSAEAKAIDLALNIITQTKSTKFIIFSDCLS